MAIPLLLTNFSLIDQSQIIIPETTLKIEDSVVEVTAPVLDIKKIEKQETSKKEVFLSAKEKAEKIDKYFAKYDLPLANFGEKFVAEAEKNNLDWRLLPAIAMRESTGGKFACSFNPFGWGSCSLEFSNFDEAIEVVAFNLGGNNPKTARHYKNKTTEKLLTTYNGGVVKTYATEVVRIMDKIQVM